MGIVFILIIETKRRTYAAVMHMHNIPLLQKGRKKERERDQSAVNIYTFSDGRTYIIKIHSHMLLLSAADPLMCRIRN